VPYTGFSAAAAIPK